MIPMMIQGKIKYQKSNMKVVEPAFGGTILTSIRLWRIPEFCILHFDL